MANGAAFVDPRHPAAHRRSVRRPIRLWATLSGSVIRRRRVTVTDITMLGCRIDARCRLDIGACLMVTLPSLAPMGGIVIWAEEDGCGFEFAQPLHPCVLDRLLEEPPAPEPPVRPVPLAVFDASAVPVTPSPATRPR